MIPNGYTLVVDADGCRYRRHVRWAEVPATARIPEPLWPFRRDPQGHCVVAVPDKPRGPGPRFRPCGRRRNPGANLCDLHARKERHPQERHVPGGSE